MTDAPWSRIPIDAQSVDAPLSRAAIFLVVAVADRRDTSTRSAPSSATSPVWSRRSASATSAGELSCVVGIGSRCSGTGCSGGRARPSCTRSWTIGRGRHTAPVHAGRPALPHPRRRAPTCASSSSRLLLDAPRRRRHRGRRGARVPVLRRARPARLRRRHREPDRRRAGGRAAVIGDDDPDFAGGSYVVVQKYLHDLPRWNALPIEEQEAIIGRTKVDNVELDDDPGAPTSHKTLTTIDGRRRRPSARSCATTCRSAARAPASSAPTSSATRDAVGDRADARAHVHRRPARDLRPHARLLDRDHRRPRSSCRRNDMLGRLAQAPDEAAESSSGGSLGIGSLKRARAGAARAPRARRRWR